MCTLTPRPTPAPDALSSEPRIAVIINAHAGPPGTPDALETVTAAFAAAGRAARILPVRSHDDLIAALAGARASRPGVLVGGGGDGTISAVAGLAAEMGIPLGVLPLGTLNHFAKDLNIPLELDGAVRAICAGRTAEIDIGEINSGEDDLRIFLNNSSLGVYPRIVRHRDGQMRKHGRSKWLALALATLTVMRVAPLFTFRLRIDGVETTWRSSLLLIGNNDYVMDGLHFGERRRLDAGHLSLYAPRRRGHAGLLALVLRALAGRLNRDAGFEIRSACEIEVTTDSPHLQVAIDGEVCTLAAPLVYRIRPRALRVLVP